MTVVLQAPVGRPRVTPIPEPTTLQEWYELGRRLGVSHERLMLICLASVDAETAEAFGWKDRGE